MWSGRETVFGFKTTCRALHPRSCYAFVSEHCFEHHCFVHSCTLVWSLHTVCCSQLEMHFLWLSHFTFSTAVLCGLCMNLFKLEFQSAISPGIVCRFLFHSYLQCFVFIHVCFSHSAVASIWIFWRALHVVLFWGLALGYVILFFVVCFISFVSDLCYIVLCHLRC